MNPTLLATIKIRVSSVELLQTLNKSTKLLPIYARGGAPIPLSRVPKKTFLTTRSRDILTDQGICMTQPMDVNPPLDGGLTLVNSRYQIARGAPWYTNYVIGMVGGRSLSSVCKIKGQSKRKVSPINSVNEFF